ncbi:hypothetical protein F5144DRAFT_611731 [Chaetomium tenue]|uniref:Uncharacterized protein n=1 Tax=Chaetomium tenue TaxID=1854479 RepID=A0ACB7PD60_9PEZI|nr:hypothetical protein F5144DRAFT_611731 [Chaetomium globosum]
MAANATVILSPESAAALTSEFTIRCHYTRPLTPQLRTHQAAYRYAQQFVAQIAGGVAATYDHPSRPDAPPPHPPNPPPRASIDFDQAQDRWLPVRPRATTTTTTHTTPPRRPPPPPSAIPPPHCPTTEAHLRSLTIHDAHDRIGIEFDLFLRGCPLAARRDAELSNAARPIHDVLRNGTPGAGRDAFRIRKRLPPRPAGDGGVQAGDGGVQAGDAGVQAGDAGVQAGDGNVQAGDGDVQAGDGNGPDGDGDDWVTLLSRLRTSAQEDDDVDDIADWEMVEKCPLGPPVDGFGFELTAVGGGLHWLWDVD